MVAREIRARPLSGGSETPVSQDGRVLDLSAILEDAGCHEAAQLIGDGLRPQDLLDCRLESNQPEDVAFEIIEAWRKGEEF